MYVDWLFSFSLYYSLNAYIILELFHNKQEFIIYYIKSMCSP